MTPLEALQQHQKLCDEIYALALEENAFLQQHRRAPEPTLLDRKRTLLGRLDQTLEALRGAPRSGGSSDSTFRTALEKTRGRILQILQLDRENEQLLLRFSLAGGRTASAAAAPPPAPSLLQKIYQRHS
jgi:hypothetical protein